jgi:hypothetical protein
VDRCAGPYVSVTVGATLATADGVFDEHLDAAVSAPNNDGTVEIDGSLPATQLHGTYEISFGAPDQVTLQLSGRFMGTQVLPGSIDEVGPTMSGGGGAIQ